MSGKKIHPGHFIKSKVSQGASTIDIQKKGFHPKTKQQKGGPTYDKQQNYKGLDLVPKERQITRKKVLDRLDQKARQ